MTTNTNNFGNLIADADTDTVFFSDKLEKKCPNLFKSITQKLHDNGKNFRLLKNTNDIWCRDYMPIQTADKRFVFYKYNPDYLQYPRYIKTITDVYKVDNIECVKQCGEEMDLVMDGGNVVKCGDKVVMTEKVFVANRNKTVSEVKRLLKEKFQCEKIVFLPWDYMYEMYGHSDGIVHYLDNERVLLTDYERNDAELAAKFRKILDKHFDVVSLDFEDVEHPHKSNWAYINYLQVGNLVLVPKLGFDEEDNLAEQQIKAALPNCKVEMVPNAMEAVNKGGALNCISWNVKI